MPWEQLKEKLGDIARLEYEPMAKHLTFRIGGPCRLMALPKTAEECRRCLVSAAELGITPLILGRGSNLLAPDEGLEAFVIKPQLEEFKREGHMITAGASISLRLLAAKAAEVGLSGLEFAHGIPGTLGGAVVMNAGAYGGEMRDVIRETNVLSMAGEEKRFTGEEHDFSYRHSVFSSGEYLLLESTMELSEGIQEDITARMEELAAKRKASQPLEYPSAGSAFKRPKEGYAAALIEQCGLKGLSVGGAQVSVKHSGFVVNTGGATCQDVLELMAQVQETVQKETGILLEPEVKLLGV